MSDENKISDTNHSASAIHIRSKERYDSAYKTFKNWCIEVSANINEESLLKYFVTRSENSRAATSLWAEYSMLKSTIWANDSIDISKYTSVTGFLKKNSEGYMPKKASVFTREDFIKFLHEAPDEIFLVVKVGMIFGIIGACRIEDLCHMKIDDIEEREGFIIVKIPETSTQAQRSFVVINEPDEKLQYLDIFYKYKNLRPINTISSRLFISYRNGKCTNQVIGRGTIGSWPSKIAEYLNLANPSNYTGHSFRRSSALFFSDKSKTRLRGNEQGCRPKDYLTDSTACNNKLKEILLDGYVNQLESLESMVEQERHNMICSGLNNVDAEVTTIHSRNKCKNLATPLHTKSKGRYDNAYKAFKTWCNVECININEASVLRYFMTKDGHLNASSLWAEYSMLKSTILANDSIDISQYTTVIDFLKKTNAGHRPNRTSLFTKDDFIKFLDEAPDEQFLLHKVGMILGIAGSCTSEELSNMKIDDIEEREGFIIVKVFQITTQAERSFIVINELEEKVQYLDIFNKYRNLRPINAKSHLLLRYNNGKCQNQGIGKNTIGKWPSVIADFLKLENAKNYTGHSFRRSSRIFSTARRDTLLRLKDYAKDKSSSHTAVDDHESHIKIEKDPTDDDLSDLESSETADEPETVEKIICGNSDNSDSVTVNMAGSNQINEINSDSMNLLPLKSRGRYVGTYKAFKNWCTEERTDINKDSLLKYFVTRNNNLKAAGGLWAEYSMLKSTILINDAIDISKYAELSAFLKKINVGYRSKKANVFTKEDFIKFLLEAPDEKFLVHKVGMILGIVGACRTEQLYNIKIDNIEERDGLIIVNIPQTAKIQRSFMVINETHEKVRCLDIFYKYRNLRPINASSSRLFLSYRNGKCRNQVIGRGTIGSWPSKIAEYLKLKDVTNYTGHSFRRSATIFVNELYENIVRCNASTAEAECYSDSIDNIVKFTNKPFVTKDLMVQQAQPAGTNQILFIPQVESGLTITEGAPLNNQIIIKTPPQLLSLTSRSKQTNTRKRNKKIVNAFQRSTVNVKKPGSLYVTKEKITNKRKHSDIGENLNKTVIETFILIFGKPFRVGKLLHLFAELFYDDDDENTSIKKEVNNSIINMNETEITCSSNNEISFESTQKDEENSTNASTNSQIKPNTRKEPSGAEKKKTKLRKDFLANLSIATPEKQDSEKRHSEKFAIAYYNKLRETLELNDYNKVMQILVEFSAGDVIDLYREIESVLEVRHPDLLEEFLYFLKEKEAAILDKLMPWLEVQMRSKFCRKLEIYFKDQPTQLKRIYHTLLELSQLEDISMEKIKTTLLPMFKGNSILTDLFLQNFKDEPPPPSLLEGPYEMIDVNKELTRQSDEEIYEKFVVSNTEDKYGGPNCICHCHNIDDNDYKGRYKHCNSCGLRFIQGKVYVQTGRCPYPATVSFETNPDADHNARLIGKIAVNNTASGSKRKRCEISPSKHQNANISGKENNDEDSEDEDVCKRKRLKGRSKKLSKVQEVKTTPKKARDNLEGTPKPRKRTYSYNKKNKKEENKQCETVVAKDIEQNLENIENNEPDGIKNLDDIKLEIYDEMKKEKYIEEYQNIEHGPIDIKIEEIKTEQEKYLEESSPDIPIESEISNPELNIVLNKQETEDLDEENQELETPWIRQEDMIILETFQKENNKESALQIICDKLQHRSKTQINSRFAKLMSLLLETLKQS